MTAALQVLLDGADPYAPDPTAAATSGTRTPASWQRWLDAVDEQVLHPAGASPDLASDLLLQFKVTTDASLLDERSAARTAYHELAESVAWAVPAAIRQPLSAWNFERAQSALFVAPAAWSITGQADERLAGIDARNGPVAVAWESARTEQDLVDANLLAQAQLGAASEVADVIALANAPRDLITEIGLLGTTVPSADPAIAAVRAVDTATAASVSQGIRQALTEAVPAGRLRVSIAGVVGALLILAALVLLRRRRHTRAATGRLSLETAGGTASEPAGLEGTVAGTSSIEPMNDDAPTQVVQSLTPRTETNP